MQGKTEISNAILMLTQIHFNIYFNFCRYLHSKNAELRTVDKGRDATWRAIFFCVNCARNRKSARKTHAIQIAIDISALKSCTI